MLHKVKLFIGFPDRLSGEGWKFYYINSKGKKLQGNAKFYATSAAGSVVAEGAEESASALGRGIEALGTGVEELGVGVEEAAKGVIIDTMPRAYFFAFLKNPSSSERGRAWEELTFSQSTSSPYDSASAITPSTPRFTDRPFIVRTRSLRVSKALANFLRLSTGISAFIFGHNRTNIYVSTWRVS
jgi:hypothetical protein